MPTNSNLKTAMIIAQETLKGWAYTNIRGVLKYVYRGHTILIDNSSVNPNCYTVVTHERAQRVSEGYNVQEVRRYHPVPLRALHPLLLDLKDLLQ